MTSLCCSLAECLHHATPTQAADPQTAEFQNLRDSYVPLFNGQPAEQKEYRKRFSLYHKKMLLSKRGGEAVLNIIGSFTGVVWRLFEDFPVEDWEKEDAFSKVLSRLDRNFELTIASSCRMTSRTTSPTSNGKVSRAYCPS